MADKQSTSEAARKDAQKQLHSTVTNEARPQFEPEALTDTEMQEVLNKLKTYSEKHPERAEGAASAEHKH